MYMLLLEITIINVTIWNSTHKYEIMDNFWGNTEQYSFQVNIVAPGSTKWYLCSYDSVSRLKAYRMLPYVNIGNPSEMNFVTVVYRSKTIMTLVMSLHILSSLHFPNIYNIWHTLSFDNFTKMDIGGNSLNYDT
jgi:hypothetical protein